MIIGIMIGMFIGSALGILFYALILGGSEDNNHDI